MDDRLRWKSGSDVEAASTPVVRPRSKGPAANAVGGGVGSKVCEEETDRPLSRRGHLTPEGFS